MRQALKKPITICLQFRAQIFWGLVIGLATSIPFLWYFATQNSTIKSKINKITHNQILSTTTEKKSREVIGFFPYWNLSKVSEVDLTNLTTIYYFAVDLNPDGSWNTKDPGWSRMKSNNYLLLRDVAKRNGIRWGVTIVNLSADSIAKNINNAARRKTIVNNTIALMKSQGFQDLNIDLEYAGSPDEELKKSYTAFVVEISQAVRHEIQGSRISIDFFSDVYKRSRIYDLPEISKHVDQVIIMGYDFHRLSSIKAGPVAPMFGKTDYEYDIASTVEGYLKLVPAQKIVLGVPFYGYEWPTESNEKNSFTIYSPRGPEISSYHRSVETAAKNKVSINFDDLSKSVWFAYFDEVYQTWRQVWFENERSLGIKFDLVNAQNLNGIAIFALGYDGSDAKPLWDEIKLKLK